MIKINQAFIFAAGRGERMRPITDTIPKPLVKVKNKAMIDYIFEKLDKNSNIDKIIVNGFYLAGEIEKHIKNLNNNKIIFSNEPAKIETGGGLVYALKQGKFDKNKPILLINGDILWTESDLQNDIVKICEAYDEKNCDILLGLKKTGELFGYEGKGDFYFDEKTSLLSKDENKNLTHVFVGLQIINPKILDKAPAEFFSMSYFYKNFKDLEIKIKGIELESRYFHIGDVESLKMVEEVLK